MRFAGKCCVAPQRSTSKGRLIEVRHFGLPHGFGFPAIISRIKKQQQQQCSDGGSPATHCLSATHFLRRLVFYIVL